MLSRIIPRSSITTRTSTTPSYSNFPLPSFLLPYQHQYFHSHSFSTSSTSSKSPSSSSSNPSSSKSSHITPSEAESKRIEEINTLPPPLLSRPLGVSIKPSTRAQTRAEWREDLLNQGKRLTERKHLVKEVSRGYFHDYNSLRHHGGKAFMAPGTLIREDMALYFANIEGTSLATSKKTHTTDLFKDKVSLVAMASFRSSEEHINSFVRPAMSDMKDEQNYQYVYINLQENTLKSFLVTMFLSTLRRSIPISQQPTYLLSHQSLEYLREPMGMENKHVGYVFLVDWNGKIRWAGCSWATLEEEESLRKCSHVLVGQLKKFREEQERVLGDIKV